MKSTKSSIENISWNFILCKERTGSSLLTAMLNQSDEILSVSEETFSLYLYPKYGKIKCWTDKEIKRFYNDFLLMHKKNLDLYFEQKDTALTYLLSIENRSFSYESMCKYLLLQFLPSKDKSKIRSIVDKQIDYLFHLDSLLNLFPEAKYVVLLRDPRDNVEACIRRGLGESKSIAYQARLWSDFYSPAMVYLEDPRFIFVTYESLILETEQTLKKILEHIGTSFHPEMLAHEGSMEKLIDQNSAISVGFEKQLRTFHEGLFKAKDQSKIGRYTSIFSVQEIGLINTITDNIAGIFGYDLQEPKVTLSEYDLKEIRKAIKDKKKLLEFYYKIPVSVKLLLKKIRKKKVDV